MNQIINSVDWFRQAIPYIDTHRHKIFVIFLAQCSHESTKAVLFDLARLHMLGVKIILVYGARKEINQSIEQMGITPHFVNNLRITDVDTLECVKSVNAMLRLELEAVLSAAQAMTSQNNSRVISGNFVIAQPIGVIDGVDFQFTGQIRKIETKSLEAQLKNIVIVSPLGFASTGEVFNLSAEVLAAEIASALSAEKLIVLHADTDLKNDQGSLIAELTSDEARNLSGVDADMRRRLDGMAFACENGVKRTHMLNAKDKGALLQELFSIDGVGTLITLKPYETIRAAQLSDMEQITALTAAPAKDGVLLSRTTTEVRRQISRYFLLERDNVAIGVVAMHPFGNMAELSCLAIAKSYKNAGRGAKLLAHIESIAKTQSINQLFVLSTQTSHWFIEQGFISCELDRLPKDRPYDVVRQSKMYLKRL